ncbi:hypothetical protein PSHT_11073 [Puccinia striiformis]|uniref:Uncharacterized protein n=1 Tax=Puccinia striiformis TaxID=27350 RepID=A0A2S4V5N6_9BASI|nr:hypothetical protein PSHT_11073 [Puccinia striiformis]
MVNIYLYLNRSLKLLKLKLKNLFLRK